jgi:hypothetical protein
VRPRRPPRLSSRALERRDLVVDLPAVVEVVLVPAGSREEKPDAVAAHAVVAGVECRATDGADGAIRVGADRAFGDPGVSVLEYDLG